MQNRMNLFFVSLLLLYFIACKSMEHTALSESRIILCRDRIGLLLPISYAIITRYPDVQRLLTIDVASREAKVKISTLALKALIESYDPNIILRIYRMQ